MRATEDLLALLHGELAEGYLQELKRLRESGEDIPPALLTSIAKFLKDNGIDRPARQESGKADPIFEGLTDELDEIENQYGGH